MKKCTVCSTMTVWLKERDIVIAIRTSNTLQLNTTRYKRPKKTYFQAIEQIYNIRPTLNQRRFEMKYCDELKADLDAIKLSKVKFSTIPVKNGPLK